jgi:hypothetical protein
LNGCSVCLEAAFKKNPEESPPPNLYAVAAWREMPYFDAAERVALALTDAITRQSEQNDGVTDELWEEARRHYDERQLAAIVLHIAVANVWNRLNVTVRQPADAPWSGPARQNVNIGDRRLVQSSGARRAGRAVRGIRQQSGPRIGLAPGG